MERHSTRRVVGLDPFGQLAAIGVLQACGCPDEAGIQGSDLVDDGSDRAADEVRGLHHGARGVADTGAEVEGIGAAPIAGPRDPGRQVGYERLGVLARISQADKTLVDEPFRIAGRDVVDRSRVDPGRPAAWGARCRDRERPAAVRLRADAPDGNPQAVVDRDCGTG